MASAVDGETFRAAVAAFMVRHDARDWEAMRSMLTDGFAFVDHRPTGFGSGESADAYLQLLRVAVDLVPDRRVNVIEPIADAPPGLLHMSATGTDEFGGAIEWDFLAVWDMRNGLLSRLEVFALDQLDSASAMAKELSARA